MTTRFNRMLYHALALAMGIFLSASAMAAGTLAYDATDKDLVKEAQGIAGTVGVNNVAEAAAAVPTGSPAVILAGHGEAGVLGLGSGSAGGYHKGQDLHYGKLNDVLTELQTINGKLGNGGILILSGCCTGKGKEGEQLLKELSAILTKATVFANTEKVGLYRKATKGPVCTVQGKKVWQQSSTVVGQNGVFRKATRDDIKAMNAAACVPS